MAKIEHIKNKRGEVIYPVSKEGAIYDENGVLLSTKIATFITRLVDNLANYYLKSETYTKGEVDDLIGAIQGFTYIVVSELPTASAETMGIVYLVPSEDPQTQNVKDEYITIRSGVEGSYTYSWEQIGSTAIDLSGYVTTEALNTALADYTTTANLTTLLAAKQDTIADLSTIRSGAAAGATAYQKPASGVPASDMASGVQTSLGKADTAYQKPGTGIPATDMASGVQTSLGKADSAYQKPSGGIPKTDLESGVQGSLELADTAVQADPIGSIVPPVDPSEFATKEEVEGLEAKVTGLFDYVEQDVEYSPGYFKNQNPMGTGYNDLAGTKSFVFNVQPGDKFKIYGSGGSSYVPMYVVADSSLGQVDVFYDSNLYRTTPKEVTIPQNGAYLYVNLLNYTDDDRVEKYVHIDGLEDKYGDIERLNETVYGTKTFSTIPVVVVPNTFYNTHNSVINPDSPGSVNTSATTKIRCDAGQVFNIFGVGNNDYVKLYAFVDSSNNVLETPKFSVYSREDGYIVTAPTNSVYLLINFIGYDSTTDKVQMQEIGEKGVFDYFNDKIDGEHRIAKITDGLQLDRYYHTGASQAKFSGVASYLSANACQCIPCSPGDVFSVFGKGNTDVVRLFAFVDKNNAWIYRPSEAIDSRADGYTITAPANSAYLVVNYLNYDSLTDKIVGLTIVQDSIPDIARKNLAGKKIVVFGDSISEYKYNGKGWCDYASEITGAEIINCAIGGTQIKSRVPLITLFSPSVPYSAGDRVYYKPDTQMRCYQFNTSHTGAWNSSDCTEITNSTIYATLDMCNLVSASCDTETPIADRFKNVEAAAQCCHDILNVNGLDVIVSRLSSIDWASIDAVILMGGVNDYGHNELGTPGGTDRTTTLGAINEIVANLCGTYKTIPFYYVSPVVQWTGFPNSHTPEKWCDVYVKSPETITLKQYAEAILNEAKSNHIPGLDLYNLCGWNMSNFSEFYTSDGTHPLRGFLPIAHKIIGFLQTNRGF